MNAIVIKSLKKNYQSVQALKGIDLTIKSGQFFGLLGPNGAGKTTLIGSIVGLVRPQSGSVTVLQNEVSSDRSESKKSIGFAPQEVNVDRFFSIRKTLEFQAGFYGYSRSFAKQRAEELLEQFRLTEKAKLPFYKLSGGMQRRLLVARALMNKPKILILDEPTAGVDVEQRHELWEYLRGLNRDGTTILLTTHYIDEAEALCEEVAVINHGLLIERGKPKNLIEKYCEERAEIYLNHSIEINPFAHLKGVIVEKNKILIHGSKIGETIGEVLHLISSIPNERVVDIEMKSGTLEDVFLILTGQSISVDENETV